ncbi:DgyrCDS8637 [Dimorphilus gyrociliatus]|uniref:DgyrCDS8637 n=1 Tax=Dimorphilus gyrociliatus TaxID=2664684 RepID=A0A7I8VZV5_9ANNE|nr:DgyrCDS8637 [Dimorphilus gyrociliatus]
MLADLHIYVVPVDLWRSHLRSADNAVIEKTVSAGYVRVHPDVSIYNLREEIEAQLGNEDIIPKEFIFLKSVGRCLTKVKLRQEYSTKVKHFLPPHAYLPEIFLLEALPEWRECYTSRSSSEHSESRNWNAYKPVPPIRDGVYRNHVSVQTGNWKVERHPVRSPINKYSIGTQTNGVLYKSPSIPKLHSETPIKTSHESQSTQTYYRSPIQTPIMPKNSDIAVQTMRVQSPEQRWRNYAVQTEEYVEESMFLVGTPPVQNSYLPPVSATPPRTPSPKYIDEDAERRRLEELRRLREEEERRRRALEEELRRQRELEELERLKRRKTPELIKQSPIPPIQPEPKPEPEPEPKPNLSLQSAPKQRSPTPPPSNPTPPPPPPRLPPSPPTPEPSPSQKIVELKHKDPPLEKPNESIIPNPKKIETLHKPEPEPETLPTQPLPTSSRKSNKKEQVHTTVKRTPTPPPPSPRLDKVNEKNRLLAELQRIREEREEIELKREELMRKCKLLHSKFTNRRDQAKNIWKQKYYEQKKKTPPIEEKCAKLKLELESTHKRLMIQMEGREKDGRKLNLDKPSEHMNLRLQATRTQHFIDDLHRKIENIKMKLTAEMKLRHQAETEQRALRAELTQKKINVTLSRNQRLEQLKTQDALPSHRSPITTSR